MYEIYFLSDLFCNVVCLICNDKISVCTELLNIIMLETRSDMYRTYNEKSEN